MSDYIRREAAVRAIDVPNVYHGIIAPLQEILCDIPAADVAPVRHGTWLPIVDANEDGSPYQAGVFCSECRHCDCVETNYCPECGAKMDGGEKDAVD